MSSLGPSIEQHQVVLPLAPVLRGEASSSARGGAQGEASSLHPKCPTTPLSSCATETTGPDSASLAVADQSRDSSSSIDSLERAYRDYYGIQISNPTPRESVQSVRRLMSVLAQNFPGTLDAFQTLNDRLFALWSEYVGRADPAHATDFFTSGSTRQSRRNYKFGPHGVLWIKALCTLMRFPFGFREIIKLETRLDRDLPVTVASDSTGLYPHVITCGPLNRTRLNELLAVLPDFLNRFPSCSLISFPDNFLYLNDQPVFQEFVIEHRQRLNLLSQFWEPFYKRAELKAKGVHFSDFMIDWSTGLNFYTCPDGFQHLLPVFAQGMERRVNLLNLMPPFERAFGNEDDLFVPRSIVLCSCGKNRLDYDFVPHPTTALRASTGEIIYVPELAEQLTSNYRSLQFIQDGQKLSIFHRVEGNVDDGPLLGDYFTNRGLSVDWKPDDLFLVGPKRPVFYRHPC